VGGLDFLDTLLAHPNIEKETIAISGLRPSYLHLDTWDEGLDL
jgi:hypothetical protein